MKFFSFLGDEKSMSGLFTFRKEVKMTQIESLIQLIIPEFLLFLEAKEKDEIVEKGLDNTKNPSIHSNTINKKGVEQWK